MCPFGRRWVNGDGSLFETGTLCAHCLLIETEEGLILVDAGLSTLDLAQPKERLSGPFRWLARPRLDLERTALHQIRSLGLNPDDVRHIIITHGDLDHAGGLADFPNAAVHVYRDEYEAIQNPDRLERTRYESVLKLPQTPDWRVHEVDGERWMGFDAVRPIPGVGPDVLMVPLFGHTRGHAGVAVAAEHGWWLHAGDAFFHGDQMLQDPSIPPGLGVFQKLVDHNRPQRVRNQARLRELALAPSQDSVEVRVFCAHDPKALASAQAAAADQARA